MCTGWKLTALNEMSSLYFGKTLMLLYPSRMVYSGMVYRFNFLSIVSHVCIKRPLARFAWLTVPGMLTKKREFGVQRSIEITLWFTIGEAYDWFDAVLGQARAWGSSWMCATFPNAGTPVVPGRCRWDHLSTMGGGVSGPERSYHSHLVNLPGFKRKRHALSVPSWISFVRRLIGIWMR